MTEARPWMRRRGCDLSASDVARRLAERMESLVHELLPGAVRATSREFRVGSVAGEAGESMRIVVDGPKAGTWIDFASGDRGDALDLIRATRGGEFKDVLAWALGWLGLGDHVMPAEAVETLRQRAEKRRRIEEARRLQAEEERREAWRLWQAGVPATGTPADAYWRGRGLGPVPAHFRFAARQWCQEVRHAVPALLMPMQAVDGRFRALHMVFIEESGAAWVKADVPVAKKTRADPTGAAVRVSTGPAGFAIGEGAETMGAVARVLNQSGPRDDGLVGGGVAGSNDWTVWACLSTSGLGNVVLPADATSPLYCGDFDPIVTTAGAPAPGLPGSGSRQGEPGRPGSLHGKRPGHVAVEAALARDVRAGRTPRAVFPTPPSGTEKWDWNDALLRFGPGPVRAELLGRGRT